MDCTKLVLSFSTIFVLSLYLHDTKYIKWLINKLINKLNNFITINAEWPTFKFIYLHLTENFIVEKTSKNFISTNTPIGQFKKKLHLNLKFYRRTQPSKNFISINTPIDQFKKKKLHLNLKFYRRTTLQKLHLQAKFPPEVPLLKSPSLTVRFQRET